MSELLDAAAALVLAAVLFLVSTAVFSDGGLIIGVAGALAAGYVGARVGTHERRIAELEARLDDET